MASKHLQSELEKLEVRIVLFGKTGVGKSTAGNLILGCDQFKTYGSASSMTTECQKGTRECDGQTLVIVDTPGLFRTDKPPHDELSDLKVVLIESNTLVQPGPHVLLLVLKTNAFSKQDKMVLETFQKVFEKAKPYTIVLFMHKGKDQCKVDEYIQKNVSEFIAESCEEHHVFTDKEPSESEVTGLLQKINNMVKKNENHYYSNEMLKSAATVVAEMMPSPMVKSAEKVITIVKEAMSKRGLEENQFAQWLVSKIGGTEIEGAKMLCRALRSYLTVVKEVTYRLMPPEPKK